MTLDNLQRQILFGTGDVGRAKTEVAAAAIGRLNPDVRVDARRERLAAANVAALLDGADLILDGSDNFATRLLVSDHATAAHIPLVSAAIGQFQAQIGTFRGWEAGRPCYRCFVGDAFDAEDCDTCSELGVLGAMAGIAGSFAALEAIRALTGFGEDAGRQAPHFRRARAGDAHDPDRQGSGLQGLRLSIFKSGESRLTSSEMRQQRELEKADDLVEQMRGLVRLGGEGEAEAGSEAQQEEFPAEQPPEQ